MVYFPVSVIILYISFIEGHNLSGTIEEDIKFYHRKLSENPSILATIEYSVTFKHHFGHKKLRIFTSDNHTAFKDKCLSSNYGQLFNEDYTHHWVQTTDVPNVKQAKTIPSSIIVMEKSEYRIIFQDIIHFRLDFIVEKMEIFRFMD